jgi:hypothetical protein
MENWDWAILCKRFFMDAGTSADASTWQTPLRAGSCRFRTIPPKQHWPPTNPWRAFHPELQPVRHQNIIQYISQLETMYMLSDYIFPYSKPVPNVVPPYCFHDSLRCRAYGSLAMAFI